MSRVLPEPPRIEGVRRYRAAARGIDFHITEAGPEDGRPVVLLHGWPQHHFAYRHLLADPPEGMRLIAPDLPGYGWSGPAPHRWAKDDVASDVLALLDEIGISSGLLVGHDWGGWIGFLLALRDPDRFEGFLALNIAHLWNDFGSAGRHMWRMALYQPLMAGFGVPLMQRTSFVEHQALVRGVTVAGAISPEEAKVFGDCFRDETGARAARDTYRTFLTKELPAQMRHPETRRLRVTTRGVFGVDDLAIHPDLADPGKANAEDYTLRCVEECGHFVAEERPEIVREELVALAAETAGGSFEPAAELSPDRR